MSVEQRPAPWPVAALAPLAAVTCVVAIALLGIEAGDAPAIYSFGGEVVIGNGVTTGLIGLALSVLSTIVLRHPGHRMIGWVLGGVGVFWALDGLSEAYVHLGLVTEQALPGMTAAVWFLARFTSLLPLTIVVLPLLFPEGRFVRGGWRVASWACIVVNCLGTLAYVVAPWDLPIADLPPGVDPDWTTIWPLEPVTAPLASALQVATVVALVIPVAVVVHRYRASSGTVRDEMRWLLWGALVTAATMVISVVLDLGALTGAVFFVCITLVPAAMTVAVVKPRIVPIEELLARTTMLAAVAVVLVAIDFAVVAALSAVLDDEMEQAQVVLVVLLTTVLLYGPVRQRLSRAVRRTVLGTRATPYDAVAGLASTLETADEGSEQLVAVARAVASAFGVGFVSVEVERSGGEQLIATYGRRPSETRTLPISYRDVQVGRLVLPARGLRSMLTRRDEELLGDLVRQAATAARTSRLAEELQDSRERLVAAREEERRRIRRDLHDGLGPALSGVVFQLESVRLLVDKDPAAAKTQVAVASRLVQDVVADVRRLVHDLRPPALDDLGLVGALRQQAQRLRPPATIVADELGALPAAVEVAAYRIASEAMTNAARHAAATVCTVSLAVVDETLVVEVCDDGVGIAAGAQVGIGLTSLRERVAELGGTSEITCPDSGGTVVRTRLPLRRRP